MSQRRSSRKNSEEVDADENTDTLGANGSPTNRKENDQWVFLINDSAISLSQDEENKPILCKLRHPKTNKSSLFLFSHGDSQVFEVTQFKEEFRSWFVGDAVQQDGSLLITTPVDPIFLVLPYFIQAEKSGKYMTLDQIVCDEDYPECTRLHSCSSLSELHQVTDMKGDDDLRAYKFDKSKTLSWLKLKAEKIADCLEENNICVSGSHSATFIRSKKSAVVSKEEYLRHGFGILSDYLPTDLSSSLREYLGIPAVPEKRPTDAENPPPKRAKTEDVAPTEDYSKANGSQAEKQSKATVKLTASQKAAQKKLGQVDKTGMKSMMSFFSPKQKT